MKEKFYTIKEISIKDVEIVDRVRDIDDEHLSSLQADIGKNGLLSPIAVRPTNGSKFRLIAGLHRTKACHSLGWKKIQAAIIDKDVPEDELELYLLLLEYNENVKRKEFSFMDKLKAHLRIHESLIAKHGDKKERTDGWSLHDTANLLGIKVSNLSNDFQLARASKYIPELEREPNKASAMRVLKDAKRRVEVKEKASEVISTITKTQPDAQLQEIIDSFFVGDFLENVKSVPNGSVNFIECDPPYGIDLTEKSSGKSNLDTYTDIPKDEYPNWIKEVISECYRVLQPGGWLIQWFAPDPWFELIFTELISADFKLNKLPGLWFKHVGQTMHPDVYMGNAYEMFFYARKGQSFLNKPGRLNVFDYFPVSSSDKTHRTERPIGLMEDLIYTFVGEGAKIMVPFLGSGNTLLAAANLKCTAFGWDISEDCKNEFVVKAKSDRPYSSKTLGGNNAAG